MMSGSKELPCVLHLALCRFMFLCFLLILSENNYDKILQTEDHSNMQNKLRIIWTFLTHTNRTDAWLGEEVQNKTNYPHIIKFWILSGRLGGKLHLIIEASSDIELPCVGNDVRWAAAVRHRGHEHPSVGGRVVALDVIGHLLLPARPHPAKCKKIPTCWELFPLKSSAINFTLLVCNGPRHREGPWKP